MLNPRALWIASALLLSLTASIGWAAPPNDAGSITNYAFSASTDTFTPLSGSTRVAVIEAKDASADAIPLGFTFWFMGVPYTQVWANSNGHLSFNLAAATTSTFNMRTNKLATGSSSLRPTVAPLWDDLSGAGTGTASYLTTGIPGSRVFTFEWLNWKWNHQATAEVISLQARLYEATGAIEFYYRQDGGAVNLGSASIGITASATGSGNYLSVQDTGAIPGVSSTSEESALDTKPASGQLYTFTPPAVVPIAPATLTFSAVSETAMTLDWADNATSEAGYTILRSTDGVNYSFHATTTADTATYAASGLVPGTTYYWRVYAVTEGQASSDLSGSQATLPAGEISCAGVGGNWSATTTWNGGALPTATDNVTINDGCTVTSDTNATINNLTVGQGTSGILQFEATTARRLTVNGSVIIAGGGTLQSAASGTVTTHLLSVGTDLTNDGMLDMSTNGDTAGAELRFVGSEDSTFGGTGATTDLRLLSLSKWEDPDLVEITLPFTVRGAAANDTNGFLSTGPYFGTLKISGNATYQSNVFLTASYTIPSSARFWLNNPNFTVNAQNGSATLTGQLRVSNGTFNVGTAIDDSMTVNSLSKITIEGGSVNVAGRFGVKSSGFTVTYVQSGGILTVATQGNTSTSFASFDLGTSAGTSLTMNGGMIVVRQANTGGSGPRDYRAGIGTYILGGGTLQFGDASSGTAKTFTMAARNSTIATVFPILAISNTSAGHSLQVTTGPVLGLGATVNPTTTLTLGGFDFDLLGNLTNDGTLTATTSGSRLRFIGANSQTWSGIGSVTTPLNELSIDNSAGVTITANPFAVLRVNLLRGTLINSDKITLGNGGATSVITQVAGSASPTSPGGSYDLAPTLNAGSGGVHVLYEQESAARTTGLEIPVTRTVDVLSVNNTNGVMLAGGGLSIDDMLTLSTGLFHTSASNLLMLGTGVASPPAGSATSYVEGPLALQVNSATNVTSRNLGIGSSVAWRPVVLSDFHSNGTLQSYTAEIIESDSGGTPDPPLLSLNPARYFRIQNTANIFSSSVATVQLSYGGDDTVPNVATGRVAQSATAAGTYASRGGGATTTPTTGFVSETVIAQGDEYFVIADGVLPVPPPNDDCGFAMTIPATGPFPYLTSTIDVAAATTTGDPLFCATTSHTAWYTFTPTMTAIHTITSCQTSAPGTTATDTVLGVFTGGSCTGPFTTVACNDDDAACGGGTSRSSISTSLNAGTTYYVVVGTAGASPPSPSKIQLAIDQILPPANDDCSAPVALSLDIPVSGTTAHGLDDYELSGTTCFTGQGQLGNTASTAVGKDVVYSFTAPAAGDYSIRVTDYTAGDAVLYTSSSCPASTFPTPVVVSTCVSAANRTSAPAEEVMCQSLANGEMVYAVVDEEAPTGGTFTIEAVACDRESESNDAPGMADTLSCGKEGSLPETDIDFYVLGTPGAGWRAFAMIDGIASAAADTQMRITDGADVWEFDEDDGDVSFGTFGLTSVIGGGVLQAGAMYLKVEGFGGTSVVEPYRLYSVLQPPIADATSETEPNDAPAAANSAVNNYFTGTVSLITDADVYSFSASAGDLVFLGLDCDSDRDGTALDGALELLASDGATVLVSVDGSGMNQTPIPSPGTGQSATTPAFAGEGLVYRFPNAGTYYAKVTGVPGASAAEQEYALSISTNCEIPPADLAVSQIADVDPVTGGTNVTYTVTLGNNGPNTAYNLTLTDNVPVDMSLVSVTPPAGWSCGAPVAGQYDCTASSLAASASAIFTMVYQANYCTGNVSTTHSLSASSDTPDPAPGDNTSDLLTNIIDPGSCSDTDACTTVDTCVGGVCVGSSPVSCDDGDACTVDSCEPATGLCDNPLVTCDDGNTCTDDSCDSMTGCVFANNDANVCSNGDLCTTDECISGSCVGTPVDCSDGIVCTDDNCDAGTGACLHTNNTDFCDDSSLCTTGDQCGPLFSEDFDGVTAPAIPAGWTTTLMSGQGGDIAFETDTTFSDTTPNAAWTDAPDHLTDKVLDSASVAVATAGAQLTFQHKYDLEDGFDGVVLEISIGGGPFIDILTAGGSFAAGGYNGTISAVDGSPIAGRSAWTGVSAGFGTAAVDLPASAAGQSVVLRWRAATDNIFGQAGYWIDSIEATEQAGTYTCSGASITCDDSNICTVDSCDPGSGCLFTPGNAGIECRPSSGELCDPAELCDGVSSACPTDLVGPSSNVGNTVVVSWDPITQTATITWSAETEEGPFNAYRGEHVSGAFWDYNHLCLANGVVDKSTTDTAPLGSNILAYYLISRTTSPCLESNLGVNGSGAERPNTSPCP